MDHQHGAPGGPAGGEEPPAGAAESMRLIERERLRTREMMAGDPLLLHLPWGLAWLIGFGLLFLRFGPGGRELVAMPEALPLAVLLTLVAAATAVTAAAGIRAGRHTMGRSAEQGAMYGAAWCLGLLGSVAVAARLGSGLPDAERMLLWSALVTGTVGLLYVAAGMAWHERPLFGLGAWVSATNTAGVAAGPGWHALVVAVCAGAGTVLFALVVWLRGREGRDADGRDVEDYDAEGRHAG